MSTTDNSQSELERERTDLLEVMDRWLEWPLVLLAGIWLVLLVLELVKGLSPALETLGKLLWGIFIADYVLRLVLAPRKWEYIRRNWLTLLALLLPAIRVLRVLRIARAARGLRLVRIISSVNRSMRSLADTMSRRGLPYVVGATLTVLLAGGAGMFAFEQHAPHGIGSYAEGLWWTAMLLTTIGSDYWPITPEGRALALLLSLYALGILGYVAGSLASFFVGREADEAAGALPSASEIRALHAEVKALREELRPPAAG